MYPHPVQRSLAAKDKIIVALDVPKLKDAQLLIKNLAGFVGLFKVGNQLFTVAGPDLVKEIIDSGSQVFLDLKFNDIPNTVRGGVESACRLGVKMLTVHLSGGKEMAEAAVAGRQNASTLILGVTVLSSSNDATLVETGITNQVKDQVLLLANLAKSAGITGLVASPLELTMLRKEFDDHFTTVIPGIRPAWAATGDQKRIMTPAEAVAAGADYLVIGRPITSAQNPKDAVNRIIEELNAIDS